MNPRTVNVLSGLIIGASLVLLAIALLGCTFPMEGTGDESSSSSSDGGTFAATLATSTSSSSASSTSTSSSTTTAGSLSGSASSSSESDGSSSSSESSSDDGDPSSTSGDASESSSSTGERAPDLFGPCGPACDDAGMLCLEVYIDAQWFGVCSPACDDDDQCGAGTCATQCVLPCASGCPDGAECIDAGPPFGEGCMWPQ